MTTTPTLRAAATKALGMELATKHGVYLTPKSAGKLVDLVLRAALAEQAAEQASEAANGDVLWLWKNGDHFLAFKHLYPCYSPGGDPMVLGQPFGRAEFRASHDRAAPPAPAAAEQAKPHVWTSVVDEALTLYHLDVANESDDYATARGKMENLLAHAGNVGAYHAAEQAEPVAWRTSAAAWLRQRADQQRKTNAAYPEHVKCYPSWEKRVRDLEWLADDLEREQASSPPAPARQEPLTEEQIKALFPMPGKDLMMQTMERNIARAVERAHGITAAPAEGGA